MRPQRIEQRLAFLKLQPDDVAVPPSAEEQALAPGFRMRAHQPVACAGSATRIGHVVVAFALEAGAVVGGVVNRLQSLDAFLHVRRQGFVGQVHVRPVSVAALGRQLQRI